VVVPPTPGVVVVLEEPAAVVDVVVELPVGALVAGVVLVDVVEVEAVVDVDPGGVVVDVVEDVVVVVVDGAGAGAGDGDGVKMSRTLVPVPLLPKTAESGWPEISSMAVTKRSAITKTMAAVPAIVFQLNVASTPGRPVRGDPAGCIGTVVASIRSVAGAANPVDPAGAEVAAEVSTRSVSPSGAAGAGGVETSSDESTSPLTTVEPSLRSRADESGARTTTCLTAS
jgi:hypothetical protein